MKKQKFICDKCGFVIIVEYAEFEINHFLSVSVTCPYCFKIISKTFDNND